MIIARPFTALLVSVLFLAAAAQAQNEIDALRYTGSGLGGTARAQGAGGAFSAVGADFSSALLNPAGMAMFNRSEIALTSQLTVNRNTTSYLGTEQKDSRAQFSFSHVDYVATFKPSKESSDFRTVNVGFGFAQTDNYAHDISASAYNDQNSICDYFAVNATGVNILDLPTDYSFGSLGWNLYLIDSTGLNGVYEPNVADNVQQTIEKIRRGNKKEWSLTAAANYKDYIYFGGTVNMVTTNYSQQYRHKEEDVNDIWDNNSEDSLTLNQLEFLDIYSTRGTGFNARAGLIVKPLDFFRLGLSVTSPTVITMRDAYLTQLNVSYDNSPAEASDELPEGSYRYRLVTPLRVTLGAAAIYRKLGFVSADFEMVDYTSTEFRSSFDVGSSGYYSFEDENQAIKDNFGLGYNLRLGAELRLGAARLRGGFARYAAVLSPDAQFYFDPVTGNSAKINASRRFLTGGFGIKEESLYLDLAYVHELSADREILYTVADPAEYSPELINRNSNSKFLLTLGFTF